MRIMSYNILKGGFQREGLIASVILAADADVVMLEEANPVSSVTAIASAAGYPYYDAHPGYSTAFMSRVPVYHRWHGVPLVRSPFLEVVAKKSNIHIWGVHLTSLLSSFTEWMRGREIQALLRRVNQAVPHVLIGDFNTLAPGDVFDLSAMPRFLQRVLWFSGGDIQREALRRLLDWGYTDAFRALHPAETGWSLPAWQPNTRLDYAFVSPHLKERIVDCRIMTKPDTVRQASDHLPLVIELNE